MYDENYDVLDARPGKIKEEVIENEQEEGTRVQHTPPQTVILTKFPRNTPVKERVGSTKSAKRTAQRTLPSKKRLGTKPSDIRQSGESQVISGTTPVKARLGVRPLDSRQDGGGLGVPGPSNPRNKKSRSERDTGCSQKRLPRAVKDHPDHFLRLRDQEVFQIGGYMFQKRASNTSGSEDEQKRSPRRNK